MDTKMIKLSELEAAVAAIGAHADVVTLGNSVASARAARLERFTVGTEILGSVVRQAILAQEYMPTLVAIAKAALAEQQTMDALSDARRRMNEAESSDSYRAACTAVSDAFLSHGRARDALADALREVSP